MIIYMMKQTSTRLTTHHHWHRLLAPRLAHQTRAQAGWQLDYHSGCPGSVDYSCCCFDYSSTAAFSPASNEIALQPRACMSPALRLSLRVQLAVGRCSMSAFQPICRLMSISIALQPIRLPRTPGRCCLVTLRVAEFIQAFVSSYSRAYRSAS